MSLIQIYDRPMCCSTGICGPAVDPVLPRFAAALETLKSDGHSVDRYNLAQQPHAFVDNKLIHSLLSDMGTDILPVVVVDGEVVSRATYPSLEMLQKWTDCDVHSRPASVNGSVSLPIVDPGCCADSAGCC